MGLPHDIMAANPFPFASSDGKVEGLSERRELSEAARILLGDKAFGHAYLALRQRWFGLLLDQPHAGPAQDELCARLRALDEVPAELAALLTDYRLASQKAARNG